MSDSYTLKNPLLKEQHQNMSGARFDAQTITQCAEQGSTLKQEQVCGAMLNARPSETELAGNCREHDVRGVELSPCLVMVA